MGAELPPAASWPLSSPWVSVRGGRRGGGCDTPAQDSGQRLSRREGLSPPPASWASVSLVLCVSLTVPSSGWGWVWGHWGRAAQQVRVPHQPYKTCVGPSPRWAQPRAGEGETEPLCHFSEGLSCRWWSHHQSAGLLFGQPWAAAPPQSRPPGVSGSRGGTGLGHLGLGPPEGPGFSDLHCPAGSCRGCQSPCALTPFSLPGAAGLSTSSNIILGLAGSALGAWLWDR